MKSSKCRFTLLLSLCLAACVTPEETVDRIGDEKPDAATALVLLKEGNRRFVHDCVRHPHAAFKRICLADVSDQSKYAYATIFCCSDSRVPPEYIFDAGFMDLFVVRVAGNVVHTAEIGSVEYGALHVNTPLVVVMGHSKCGAITAVANSVCCSDSTHHTYEKNILDAVKPIVPVVQRIAAENPGKTALEIAELSVADNVKSSISDILKRSPEMRGAVRSGKIMMLGAIYHLDTHEVEFLPENTATNCL